MLGACELTRSRCHRRNPLTTVQVTRWVVIGTFDALLELLILGLAFAVIVPLHMTMQRKVQALICFVLRLPYANPAHIMYSPC